jgi:hypothetical protein
LGAARLASRAMTHQLPPLPCPGADPGRQFVQLREALLLVRRIAGAAAEPLPSDRALDEAAQVSAAYDSALPVAQRRFDALAAEAAAWAAAGVEALLAAAESGPATAAAGRLADEIDQTLAQLAHMLRREGARP